jgi:hypothetical protein
VKMNREPSTLSEILFFGMVLQGGEEETYSIDNESGQMEICHLTNCALVSESTSKKPIYIRMKSPDIDSQFVIGALVPGQLYSFTTDLMITPDTVFSHTGRPEDEIHLTGYRYALFVQYVLRCAQVSGRLCGAGGVIAEQSTPSPCSWTTMKRRTILM